jgi:hypothetical protein
MWDRDVEEDAEEQLDRVAAKLRETLYSKPNPDRLRRDTGALRDLCEASACSDKCHGLFFSCAMDCRFFSAAVIEGMWSDPRCTEERGYKWTNFTSEMWQQLLVRSASCTDVSWELGGKIELEATAAVHGLADLASRLNLNSTWTRRVSATSKVLSHYETRYSLDNGRRLEGVEGRQRRARDLREISTMA